MVAEFNQADKDKFLYPRYRYYGHFTPEYLAFNANLQEFAQKVGYITDLETVGKISPEQAYRQIKALWTQLDRSKEELGIDSDSSPETT
ncbi:MAG: hypothetical protein QNJ51_26490 [Calothrix sp. MO_167.B12]|nr:hypothetical protein [Calothrix sp. MO_167.B12]